MSDLPEREAFGDYGQWPGRAVLDPTGTRVGEVREIYLDDATDQPEWVLVDLGDEGSRFVPLAGATVDDDAIRVALDSGRVKDAPALEPSQELTQREEQRLYSHYGLSYSEDESASLLPTTEEAPAAGAGAGEPATAGVAGDGEGTTGEAGGDATGGTDGGVTADEASESSAGSSGLESGDASTDLPTAAGGRPRLRRYEAALPKPGDTSEPEDTGPMVPPRPEPVAPTPPPPPPPPSPSGPLGAARSRAVPIAAAVGAVVAVLIIILRRRS